MLKRAWIWLGLAVLPGFFGFVDIMGDTVAVAQVFFYICIGFSIFSFLLSLFEAAEESVHVEQQEPELQSVDAASFTTPSRGWGYEGTATARSA